MTQILKILNLWGFIFHKTLSLYVVSIPKLYLGYPNYISYY